MKKYEMFQMLWAGYISLNYNLLPDGYKFDDLSGLSYSEMDSLLNLILDNELNLSHRFNDSDKIAYPVLVQ